MVGEGTSGRSRRTVTTVCEAHRQGTLDPSIPGHVLAQLEAEGYKRLESFLFERLFTDVVSAEVCAQNVAIGWMFAYSLNEERTPKYWFRVMDLEESFKEVDHRLIENLLQEGCRIIVVRPSADNYSLTGAEVVSNGEGPSLPLDRTLSEVTGLEEPSRKPSNYRLPEGTKERKIEEHHRARAMDRIREDFSPEELHRLSVSRLLINCYLFPWFGSQPMDLDLCYLSGDRIRFVEFKRKYPARNGNFGIDEDPHAQFARWLEGTDMTLLYVILCDPLRDNSVSPVHLLDESSVTAAHAVWLGLTLSESSYAARGELRTTGADSGMSGGDRTQRSIKPTKFRVLGKNMYPELLSAFLKEPEGSAVSEATNKRNLDKNHEHARKAYLRTVQR